MRYLSLFTGIGCDALAIHSIFPGAICVGFSEIDPDALTIYQRHFPTHKNLGDIKLLSKDALNALGPIDLVIGGSPCQGFSQAGKQKGLSDARSELFWQFVRIVKESNTKYFVLENVASMKLADRKIISDALSVSPVMIQSALLTAQNRRRLYWCNFHVDMPSDRKIYLDSVVDRYEPTQNKPECRTGQFIIHGCDLQQIAEDYESHGIQYPFAFGFTRKQGDNRTNPSAKCSDFEHVPRTDNKSNACIRTQDWTSLIYDGHSVRRLIPRELEILQGLPTEYTKGLTDMKRHRLIGNGFTVPVIEHIVASLCNIICT